MSERQRRADAIARLQSQLAAVPRHSDWLDLPSAVLGDHSPRQVRHDGDLKAVGNWIAEGYARSDLAAERLRRDPEIMELVATAATSR